MPLKTNTSITSYEIVFYPICPKPSIEKYVKECSYQNLPKDDQITRKIYSISVSNAPKLSISVTFLINNTFNLRNEPNFQ